MTKPSCNILRRCLIAGGGTGGHITPALALCETLQRRHPEAQLWYCGRPHSIEHKLVRAHGITYKSVRAMSPARGLWSSLHCALVMLLGFLQSIVIILTCAPQVIIGFGGYTAVPPLLAGLLLRRHVVVHEANALPGRAVRLLVRAGAHLACGMPPRDHDPALRAAWRHMRARATLTGNPLRQAFLDASPERGRQLTGFAPAAVVLMILGGSQGSHMLNTCVPEMVRLLLPVAPALHVVHIAGVADADHVRKTYHALHMPHFVAGFSSDIGALMRIATLVIARAGALTISELCVAAVPAILVPYPHAADNHQDYNARVLSDAGAAVLLPETALTPARLAETAGALLAAPARRAAMQAALRRLAVPDAAERLATLLESCRATS
jgi:UDP-N-acetylglucosamine--N-acetylmuramyl-(pentapeptide) pyrophosphoryl-undecaprenol N-acetylglucosamine transferase